MRFVAIDIETANTDMDSSCQIGLSGFVGGRLAEEWCTPADPEDCFDEVNISIHDIEPKTFRRQPPAPDTSDRRRSHSGGPEMSATQRLPSGSRPPLDHQLGRCWLQRWNFPSRRPGNHSWPASPNLRFSGARD